VPHPGDHGGLGTPLEGVRRDGATVLLSTGMAWSVTAQTEMLTFQCRPIHV
jgi:hypothetical protein